ncbi:MAG TPA: phosphocholine cytidylyltransferase family protein [Kofleriaceae bacterium]|nr:phosphocholine cytidylyltransferase family protein [Kofleriaceae bacterium]
MKAVILAAGSATRLRPLTEHTPKCLLHVADQPILRRLLDHLSALGVDQVTIVLGYLGSMIRDAVASWRPTIDVRFVDNAEYASTNNGYSTLLAREAVAGQEFLLLDADIVCEREVIAAVIDHPNADCLAVRPSTTLGTEEMKVVVDDRGRVRTCDKRVDPSTAMGESLGINRFSPDASTRFFDALDDRVRGRGLVNEWNDSAVQQMIDEQGYELWPVDVGTWYCAEIDTPADLEEVDRRVRVLVERS